MVTVTQMQASLQARGLEVAVIQEHGIDPLLAHAASLGQSVEPWLDALERYVLALAARTPSLWSPLRFVLMPFARCAGPQVEAFDGLLQQACSLLEKLKNNTTRTEQYGLAAAAQALPNRPADLHVALTLALELAEKGHDPGWVLQLVVPGLAAAKSFAVELERYAVLLRALSARSVFIGYQVATGLAAVAKAAPDASAQPWLDVLARLPRPSAVFEHGLPAVLRDNPPAVLVTQALEIALELTDRTIEPLAMLQVPNHDERMLAVAFELARAGIEPSGAMGNGFSVLAQLGWLTDDGERLVALSKSLKANGLTQRVFEETFSQLAHLEASHGLGLRTLELIEALAAHGFEPTLTVGFGFNRALYDVEKYPFLVKGCLDLAFTLVEAGISPDAALSYAVRPLAELAAGDEAEFTRLRVALESLIISLHAMGLDSGNVLFHDVRGLIEVGGESATFIALAQQLQRLLQAWLAAKLDPAPLVQEALPSALRAAVNRPWVLQTAIDLFEKLVLEGRADAALQVLTSGLSSASLAFGSDEQGLRTVLSTLEQHTRGLPAALVNPVSSAACIVAQRDVELLAALLDVMVAKLVAAEPGVRLHAALSLPVLASVVTTPESLGLVIDAVVEAAMQVPAENLDDWLRGPLEAASSMTLEEALVAIRAQVVFAKNSRVLGQAAAVAHLTKTSAALVQGLTRIATVQLSEKHAFDFAVGVALKALDVDDLVARLDVLEPLLRNAETAPSLLDGLRRIEPTLARVPSSWHALVRPLLVAHQGRAGPLLMAVAQLGSRHLTGEADCNVLREIVTQLGVRALDALQGLIVPGVYSGAIPSLASHGALLRSYLRDIGFHEPVIFAKYVEIQRDTSISPEVRKARTQGLHERIEQLSAAVRAGDASLLDDPLFGVALLHVFPPAVSVTQDRAVALVRRFEDRPDDVKRWPGEPSVAIELPSGGHRFREGHQLDLKPWALAHELLNALPERVYSIDAALGWALLRSWSAGEVARAASRRLFLSELLHSLGAGQSPAGLFDSPSQLLAVKDVLADGCSERIERVLLAARSEDEATYHRLVEARLAPRTVLGPKLLNGVAKTVQRWRDGLPDDEARSRLQAQLPGLVLDEAVLARLRRTDSHEEMLAILSGVPVRPFVIEPGREVSRIHGELFGQELHAMQAALFGREGQPGALEYHRAASALSLRLEVTKRQAHAAIGYAEGVCVAGDHQLWQRPEFLQAVLWNSDGIAQGGVHLLIVEEAGQRFLALPGINPSSALLEQVEPGQVVDALLAAAKTLAAQWGLSGVWLPDSPAILSNRHAVYSAIVKLQLPERKTAQHAFSFSPFAYSFNSVWVA